MKAFVAYLGKTKLSYPLDNMDLTLELLSKEYDVVVYEMMSGASPHSVFSKIIHIKEVKAIISPKLLEEIDPNPKKICDAEVIKKGVELAQNTQSAKLVALTLTGLGFDVTEFTRNT